MEVCWPFWTTRFSADEGGGASVVRECADSVSKLHVGCRERSQDGDEPAMVQYSRARISPRVSRRSLRNSPRRVSTDCCQGSMGPDVPFPPSPDKGRADCLILPSSISNSAMPSLPSGDASAAIFHQHVLCALPYAAALPQVPASRTAIAELASASASSVSKSGRASAMQPAVGRPSGRARCRKMAEPRSGTGGSSLCARTTTRS